MASRTMSVLLLCAVYLILVNNVDGHRKIPLNDAEKEECKKFAGLKEFVEESSYKERSKVCEITCAFKDKLKGEIEEKKKFAPDGEKCCLKGDKIKEPQGPKGKGSRKSKGKCKDGKCIKEEL